MIELDEVDTCDMIADTSSRYRCLSLTENVHVLRKLDSPMTYICMHGAGIVFVNISRSKYRVDEKLHNIVCTVFYVNVCSMFINIRRVSEKEG